MTNHDKASMAVSSIFSQVPLRAKLLMVTCSNATEHSKVCSAHVPLTWWIIVYFTMSGPKAVCVLLPNNSPVKGVIHFEQVSWPLALPVSLKIGFECTHRTFGSTLLEFLDLHFRFRWPNHKWLGVISLCQRDCSPRQLLQTRIAQIPFDSCEVQWIDTPKRSKLSRQLLQTRT